MSLPFIEQNPVCWTFKKKVLDRQDTKGIVNKDGYFTTLDYVQLKYKEKSLYPERKTFVNPNIEVKITFL